MDAAEIISLLEKPTKDRRPLAYYIRDKATISDIVAALQASTIPLTRRLLCSIVSKRFRVGFFEKGFSDATQAVPALIEALADPDEGVRSAAIEALWDIGDPAAGPALFERYHKEVNNSAARILLAYALGACQYVPAIPTLIEALSAPDRELRRAAARGLRSLQAQEAKEPLQKALTSETDPSTIQVIEETLQELEGPPEKFTLEAKIGRLIAQIKNGETAEREAAATALGDMVNEQVLPPVLALLNDEQSEVRQYATWVLAWLSEGRDTDWFVRVHRKQIQGPLIQALLDQEGKVRAAAAQALGDWGDVQAVEPLLELVQDEDPEVRRQVVEALGYLKDERALEPLLNAFFTDDDERVRAFAAQSLGNFEDNRAVNALILGLQDGQAHVRRNAAEMLCWLRDERAVDALLRALQDQDREVREEAIEALWELCVGKGDDLSAGVSEKMREPLLQALQDEDIEVRESASKILHWLGIVPPIG
jgi:HEAT repeat protein